MPLSWGKGRLNATVQLLHHPVAIEKQALAGLRAQKSSAQWQVSPHTSVTSGAGVGRAATPSLHQPILMCDWHVKPVSLGWWPGNSKASAHFFGIF